MPNDRSLRIAAQSGAYDVRVLDVDHPAAVGEALAGCSVIVIDERVWGLHRATLAPFVSEQNLVFLTAQESEKTGPGALALCERLLEKGLRRGDTVGVIGGGIIQDLATFACSSIMRGVDWAFVPTTLLAMADSCIGGKSSLNLGRWKNILGNFYPPTSITIWPGFLTTLDERDVRSGLAEAIKVHFLSGPDMVSRIEADLQAGVPDLAAMPEIIYRSLALKARIIEEDEFDTGLRLTMNYGHTFGHALESATDFALPHGIAVGFGADLANRVAQRKGQISEDDFARLHRIVAVVSRLEDWVFVDADRYLEALRRDKKNRAGVYGVILPGPVGAMALSHEPMDGPMEGWVRDFLAQMNGAAA